MLIKKAQIVALEQIIRASFLEDLLGELIGCGVITANDLISLSDLNRIVDDALGAGIIELSLIYRYCEIIISNKILLSKPFPDWAKNILYSDTAPLYKIDALQSYISFNNAEK